jgi:hypothetical protein
LPRQTVMRPATNLSLRVVHNLYGFIISTFFFTARGLASAFHRPLPALFTALLELASTLLDPGARFPLPAEDHERRGVGLEQ